MRGFLLLSGYNAVCESLYADAAPGRRSRGDAGACGNSLAKASRNATATYEQFVLATRQLLATANARACSVECHAAGYEEYDLGFRVRRHGDYLYVTEAAQETRLQSGMRITAVGKTTVPFLLKDLGADVFWGRGTDREDWDLVLRMYDDIDVFPGDGSVERLDLHRYPVERAAPTFEVKSTCDADGQGVLVARIDDLSDADRVDTLVRDLEEGLASGAHRLVLDLRRCVGEASPSAYLSLLPLLVDHAVDAHDVMPDTRVYTVYSRNNADLLVKGIERAAQAAGEAFAQTADELISAVKARSEEVLAAKRTTHSAAERARMAELPELVPSLFCDEVIEVGAHAPTHVDILVDTTTGVGAERLAQAVMGMEKVRLVGRMTPGLVDYANYVAIPLEGIDSTFTYPISRTAANHAGEGYAFCGLPLDVHVPFEPRECSEDTILEAALSL